MSLRYQVDTISETSCNIGHIRRETAENHEKSNFHIRRRENVKSYVLSRFADEICGQTDANNVTRYILYFIKTALSYLCFQS